jgi:hypothetical protein
MTELLTHPNSAGPAPAGAMAAPPPAAAAVPPAGRDFSRQRKRLIFTIDDDTFEAAAGLPGDVFAEFVSLYDGRAEADSYRQQRDMLKQALSLALFPDSYERFANRLQDKANPIDDEQMADVVMWLLEEYGMRPTEPSESSSDGPASPESGTNSTANTQPEASTSEPSQPTAS